MASIEDISIAFVLHYYTTFDSNRTALAGLYQDQSMLSFEGEKFQGAASIVQKLASLSFQSVKHTPQTYDCQPSVGGSIIVFVSGNLQVDGSENPLKFSQVFTLLPGTTPGSLFVLNDLFRLNYG